MKRLYHLIWFFLSLYIIGLGNHFICSGEFILHSDKKFPEWITIIIGTIFVLLGLCLVDIQLFDILKNMSKGNRKNRSDINWGCGRYR